MKNIRAAVTLFLLAVFLAGTASANTSSVNPNVPAQNSPLSSSILRGNFGNAYNDINTIYGMLALSSNELLGTVNAGNAGPLNLPTCSTGALSWTPGTGFGCNAINGLTSPVTQALVFTGSHAINLNATGLPTKQVGTVIQLGNADTVASRIENDAFAAPAYFSGIRFDGTNASPTTLQNLDEISGINAWGYNGSSVVGPRASVREFAAQNWTGSAQGTRIDISTTLNNTTTMSPVCGFENDGGVTCPPTVTGGDMGAGRINAAGLFVNGVAVSTGNSAISALTAALATNSIENGAFAQVWNWDGLTTQTALQLTGTGITTGQLLNSSIANAASTGYAGYFSNTGTAIAYGVYATEAGAANTGYAGYFNNTATATGYALYANGTATINGNLTVTGTCTGCGGGSVTAVTFANTTTGAPAAGFTGLHQRLANAISLSTTGADGLTITSTGGVGIGTVTPATPFDVEGSSTTGQFQFGTSANASLLPIGNFLSPNLGTASAVYMQLGVASSNGNSGQFGYVNEGAANANNYFYMAVTGSSGTVGAYSGHVRLGPFTPFVAAPAAAVDISGALNLSTTATPPASGIYTSATSVLDIPTNTTKALEISAAQVVTLQAPYIRKGFTVATLPAGTIGMFAYVTDAVSCTFLGTLTGSGSTVCPVFYNRTAWLAE